MLSDRKMTYSDNEILEKGSMALIKELGYSGFLRFIRYMEAGSDDYLKIQDELYKDISLDEMYEEAKNNWEEKNAGK